MVLAAATPFTGNHTIHIPKNMEWYFVSLTIEAQLQSLVPVKVFFFVSCPCFDQNHRFLSSLWICAGAGLRTDPKQQQQQQSMLKAAGAPLPPRLANGHGPLRNDISVGQGGLSALGEVALVREVLCACQGFDGRHVRFNPAAMRGSGGFDIAPEAGVPPVQRHLMLKLCELGWLFRCAASCPCCSLCTSKTTPAGEQHVMHLGKCQGHQDTALLIPRLTKERGVVGLAASKDVSVACVGRCRSM